MISLVSHFAISGCSHFLGFPTWYEYLKGTCDSPTITSINDVWLIVAAIIEILLRIAGMAAVAFVMYGGFQYLTSQAEPDAVNKARQTIINALVGLAIAILAATLVNFVAGSIH
jgi:ABC-type Fe3+ transport system permease subunit